MLKRSFIFCCLFGLFLPLVSQAQAPRIINQNQINQNNRVPERRENTALPETGGKKPRVTTSRGSGRTIILRSFSVSNSSLSPQALQEFWARWKGKKVTTDQIADIAADLKKFYSENDYALYAVNIPEQDFTNGHIQFQAVEGSIGEIEFVGDTDHDLSLVRAYAAKVVADKPLHRSTFQRYLLLMGDIPGLSVDPVFLPLYPERGIIKLEVALERKPVELGATYTNQGLGSVARSQFDARLAFNSMLRQGDITEFGYGFPDDFERYRLLSVFHEQAIGAEGTRLSLFYNNFHSTPNDFQDGKSYLTVLQLTHPLLRSKENNIFVNVSLDRLDNKNAILGQLVSDESTRVIRGGITGDTLDDDGNFTSAFLNFSKGIDAFGARQDLLFGEPDFLKGNLQLRRDQELPGRFSARLRSSTQFTGESLPSSEQIVYGGLSYGGAFEIARFAGDRGILAAGELVYQLNEPFSGKLFQQPEIYGFADWGYQHNIDDTFLPARQEASSAGFGIRLGLFDHALVQFQAGHPLQTPDDFDPEDDEWRYFVQVRSAF